MITPPVTTSGKQKKPGALLAGGLVLSGLAIVFYILVVVCVIGFVIGIVITGFATAHGIKPLIVMGLVIVTASVVWGGVFGWAAIAFSVAQIGGLAMNAVALRRAGKSSAPSAHKTRALALIGIIVGVLILAFFTMAVFSYRAQQNAKHHALDADYILQVADYVESYRASPEDEWRFAPSLAAAEIPNYSGHFEQIIHMPAGHIESDVIPSTAKKSDWPQYAAGIDDKSDYRYVGNDLVHSRALQAVAPRIVVLYNKTPYDGGRTVAFANRTQRFVKNADLPALFADASAARATLGLPPITLDGPAPAPP